MFLVLLEVHRLLLAWLAPFLYGFYFHGAKWGDWYIGLSSRDLMTVSFLMGWES
jgi:hypothetical protein